MKIMTTRRLFYAAAIVFLLWALWIGFHNQDAPVDLNPAPVNIDSLKVDLKGDTTR